jgi:hypothetical protein
MPRKPIFLYHAPMATQLLKTALCHSLRTLRRCQPQSNYRKLGSALNDVRDQRQANFVANVVTMPLSLCKDRSSLLNYGLL